jgi:hypothetical protein
VGNTLLKTTQPAVLARMAQHLRGRANVNAAPKAQPAAPPQEASAPRPPAPSYEELQEEDARRMERYRADDQRPLANGPNGAEEKPSTKDTKGHEERQ